MNAPERRLHGYDGEWAGGMYKDSKTFSYGIFPLVRTADGRNWKRGKVIVRVSGYSYNAAAIKAETQRICDELDAGTYDGPKLVFVK